MKYYLSIDADYWNGINDGFQDSIKSVLNLLKQAKVPVKIVQDHHRLLRHMNSFRYSHLVNLDYHADLCDGLPGKDLSVFDCGTWGNYIKAEIKKNGTYIWVYSDPSSVTGSSNNDSEGYCNHDPKKNPFLVKKPMKICGWKKTIKVHQELPKDLWKNIVAAGICFSPDFTTNEVLSMFKKTMREMKFRKIA